MVFHSRLQLTIDVERTTRSISKLPESQQKILACYIAGAFQTPEGLKHWKEDYDGEVCPFCKQNGNSKKHLFFECPTTHEARQKYANTMDDYREWWEIIFSLPVCTIDVEENMLNRIRYARPVPKASFNFTTSESKTFFTDGSATVADLEVDREAAWAIVEDLCQLDLTREVMIQHYFQQKWQIPPTFKTLQVGMVHGPQTINRAELTAILVIIDGCDKPTIYTDSSYAIHLVLEIIKDPSP